MGGVFGVASKNDCVRDVFLVRTTIRTWVQQGRNGILSGNGFERSIHNIENAPFRTKFEVDLPKMSGNIG